jgi:hypothetical protein
MRLSIRLAAIVGMMVVVAFGLIYLRTGTIQGGNRLHGLFGQKRTLVRACFKLELAIAGLKNQERMRQEAAGFLQADKETEDPCVPTSVPRSGNGGGNGRNSGAARERSLLVNRPARPAP